MVKNNNITASTTPSLKIRLKLNTINADNTVKAQKPSSPKLKEKKKVSSKKRKSKYKMQSNQKNQDYVINDKLDTTSPRPPKPSRSVYWTSERIESTKLILRTVILTN